MVAPESLIDSVSSIKKLLDHGMDWLKQSVLADFLASGDYSKHLRRIRRSYAQRLGFLRAALQSHFGDTELWGDQGGMHVAWKIPDDCPGAVKVAELAATRGVGVYPVGHGFSRSFGLSKDHDRVVILGYAAVLENYIQEGIDRIAEALGTAAQ